MLNETFSMIFKHSVLPEWEWQSRVEGIDKWLANKLRRWVKQERLIWQVGWRTLLHMRFPQLFWKLNKHRHWVGRCGLWLLRNIVLSQVEASEMLRNCYNRRSRTIKVSKLVKHLSEGNQKWSWGKPNYSLESSSTRHFICQNLS